MRLKERTLITIEIAPRIESTDALGGRSEAFSQQHISLRASCLPECDDLKIGENGLKNGEGVKLLVPGDAQVKQGDAVLIGEKQYIVRRVARWTAHTEIECGAAL